MASVTPRLSGLWADSISSSSSGARRSSRMRRMASSGSSYFSHYPPEGADEEEGLVDGEGGDGDGEEYADEEEEEDVLEDDERTPLDKTIDRIGMGSYQWTLLSLCGFGWMADNMWLQTVAIILPRVQQHYSISDGYIGILSASLFAGMMIGAIGWGTCSDLMGRSTAFNATLFFTAIFGMLASFARSYTTLCLLLFFLGSAVGGSMPTDGTLLLEHMPNGKQYLVTALSVFFSLGSVLSAVAALLILPQHSCQHGVICDVEKDNQGWKYLLLALGLLTLTLFLARMVFFTLHESPRYLVHAGRAQEALESLQMISRFNGDEMVLHLGDVQDTVMKPDDGAEPSRGGEEGAGVGDENKPFLARDADAAVLEEGSRRGDTTHTNLNPILFDASPSFLDPAPTPAPAPSSDPDSNATIKTPLNTQSQPPPSQPPQGGPEPAILQPGGGYSSTSSSSTPSSLEGHVYDTPASEVPMPLRASRVIQEEERKAVPRPRPLSTASRSRSRPRLRTRRSSRPISSLYENRRIRRWVPRTIRRPLVAWAERVGMVLSPEWVRTTVVVWVVWCSMALAYTMFNVFLPKLLELGSAPMGEPAAEVVGEKSLRDNLWDVVIFTVGGCPGAIIGAYLVDTRLGRRWSLASSTFVTAFFCAVFVWVRESWAVRMSTVGINLSATTMWAVLYGWTPEIFTTEVRGSACGIASALSRIGGMIAPILGGILLMIDRVIPVWTSVVVFVIGGFCVLMLSEKGPASSAGGGGGKRSFVH